MEHQQHQQMKLMSALQPVEAKATPEMVPEIEKAVC